VFVSKRNHLRNITWIPGWRVVNEELVVLISDAFSLEHFKHGFPLGKWTPLFGKHSHQFAMLISAISEREVWVVLIWDSTEGQCRYNGHHFSNVSNVARFIFE